LQHELTRYYKQDEPAYRKWFDSTFAPDRSRQQQIIAEIRETSELIFKVKREAYFSGLSEVDAYRRVMAPGYLFVGDGEDEEESAQGFSFGSESDADNECDCEECTARRRRANAGSTDQYSEEEDGPREEAEFDAMFEAMAEDLFANSYGEDFMSHRQGRKAFESFRRKLAKDSGYDRVKAQFKANGGQNPGMFGPTNDGQDRQIRCAVLYRALVKRLHPDLNLEQTRLHKELWQMTQDAYQRGDLMQLQKVQVLFAMLKGSQLDGLAVADVRAAADELKHKNTAARKQIRQLKRGEIWGFSDLSETQLQQRTAQERRRIAQERNYLEQELRQNETIIKSFQISQSRSRQGSRGSWGQQAGFKF